MARITLALLIFIFAILQNGCKKDESLTHISDLDSKVLAAVNKFRVENGLQSITHQYILADDAKNYSSKMASDEVAYGIDGVLNSLSALQNNLGGDACGAVVQMSEFNNADTIVNRMIRDPLKQQVLKQNFNQTSVGSAKDSEGNWFVTLLFIHIPSK